LNITDLRAVREGSELFADVCIVGSGPAGLMLAAELSGSGTEVVLLESGDLERNAWAESMNEIISVGVPRVMDVGEVRNRVFGGTSATWGGRMAMLSEIDYRKRAWVTASGWPITAATMAPYYRRAAQRLGMNVADPNAVLGLLARRLPPPEGDDLLPFLWTFAMHNSLRPDFLRFGPWARGLRLDGITCFVNATVTQIETDDGGTVVTRLELKAPDRRPRWIKARHVVLCAGGIENARLLLASNRIVRTGLGNSRDLVGRYLMDHPRGPVARFPHGSEDTVERRLGDLNVRAASLPAVAKLPRSRGRTWLAPGYALGPQIQEHEQLLNCAVFLTLELAEDDPLTAILAIASGNDLARNAGHVLAHPRTLAASVGRMLSGRQPARRLSGLHAQCIVEQAPDPFSRLTLGDRTDVLGVPLARIDWRTSEQEARTVRRTTKLFVDEMRRLGLAAPVPLPMIENEESPFFLPDVAHPSGTTRMSSDPRSGVVDADCAVHGVHGLHVLGSSVFPTNGHANPTYTIAALAVRLGDHLKQRLVSGG
jgi:choline dehydrogenase-like flavoprotein